MPTTCDLKDRRPPLPLLYGPSCSVLCRSPRSTLRLCRRDSASATSHQLDQLPDYLLDLLLAIVGVTDKLLAARHALLVVVDAVIRLDASALSCGSLTSRRRAARDLHTSL